LVDRSGGSGSSEEKRWRRESGKGSNEYRGNSLIRNRPPCRTTIEP
jgi:hypothetical protein